MKSGDPFTTRAGCTCTCHEPRGRASALVAKTGRESKRTRGSRAERQENIRAIGNPDTLELDYTRAEGLPSHVPRGRSETINGCER